MGLHLQNNNEVPDVAFSRREPALKLELGLVTSDGCDETLIKSLYYVWVCIGTKGAQYFGCC